MDLGRTEEILSCGGSWLGRGLLRGSQVPALGCQHLRTICGRPGKDAHLVGGREGDGRVRRRGGVDTERCQRCEPSPATRRAEPGSDRVRCGWRLQAAGAARARTASVEGAPQPRTCPRSAEVDAHPVPLSAKPSSPSRRPPSPSVSAAFTPPAPLAPSPGSPLALSLPRAGPAQPAALTDASALTSSSFCVRSAVASVRRARKRESPRTTLGRRLRGYPRPGPAVRVGSWTRPGRGPAASPVARLISPLGARRSRTWNVAVAVVVAVNNVASGEWAPRTANVNAARCAKRRRCLTLAVPRPSARLPAPASPVHARTRLCAADPAHEPVPRP